MEETKEEITLENQAQNEPTPKGDSKLIAGAILIAGILIAGAVLLKGSSAPRVATDGQGALQDIKIKPVDKTDRILGSEKAKVTLIMYEDFQCPWCGKFENESEQTIRSKYVSSGEVLLVYRDFAFLGPESSRAAEAGMCASEQGKFWDYHDYLFTHQNGENQGAFADPNLKNFAKIVGLDTTLFNGCLDSGRNIQAVKDSKIEGTSIGVRGTPKGFILKKGKVVDSIDGYLPTEDTLAKIEAALK